MLKGGIPVGASMLTRHQSIFSGANIEGKWRTSLHAEMNAIAHMCQAGEREIEAMALVTVRDGFGPCGACLDWLMYLGGPDTEVLTQGNEDTPEIYVIRELRELVPYYPR